MENVKVNDLVASTLRSAAVGFARRSMELAGTLDYRDTPAFDNNPHHEIARKRVAEQTIGAVIVSVASVEGLLNEILAGSVDSLDFGRPPEVSSRAYARWGRMWNRGVFESMDLISKVQSALEVADIEPLPSSKGSLQDISVLISLRNELVHSKPKYRFQGHNLPQKKKDGLEKKLTGKFPDSPLASRYDPFIWQKCLGPGCARWAVETETSFQNELFQRLGININASCQWDVSS
jgi:hypothetical protein